MDILSLLDAPVSYLEQKKYNFSNKDDAGFTVLHYATLKMNFMWLLQAVNLPDSNTHISAISANNSIPNDLIPKLRKSENKSQLFIPFGPGGYSILHLMIYMINHYKNDTHIDRLPKMKEISDTFQQIVSKSPSLLAQTDGNNLSVFEYIILFNLFDDIVGIEEQLNHINYVPFLINETLDKLISEKNLSPLIVAKIKSLRTQNDISLKFSELKTDESHEDESFDKL